jgi:hypothetical protein
MSFELSLLLLHASATSAMRSVQGRVRPTIEDSTGMNPGFNPRAQPAQTLHFENVRYLAINGISQTDLDTLYCALV